MRGGYGAPPSAVTDNQSMAPAEVPNVVLIREYLSALQRGEAGDALRRFFSEDAVQVELPNLLNRNGQQSNVDELVRRSLLGRQLLGEQQYEILSVTAEGDSVAVESLWTGRLAVPLGTLVAGAEMKAAFAMFFQLRNGCIVSQRNYDCFYPW